MDNEKKEHLNTVSRKLRTIMERDNIDAVIVTTCDNFYHVTGIFSFFMYTFRNTGTAIAVVFRDVKIPSLIIMNEFEAANLTLDMPNAELKTFPIWVDVDDPFNIYDYAKNNNERPIFPPIENVCNILKEFFNDTGVLNKKIAIDLNVMSNGSKRIIDTVMPYIDFIDSSPIFNELRMIKSPWEIKRLRKSAEITEYGITEASKLIQAGCTSAELTAAYKAAVMSKSETNFSRFHLISIGADFSPKLIPNNTKACSGDLIKFDCGVDVDGYGADIARTFVVGEPPEITRKIYQIIRTGHEHMLSMIAPGIKMKDVFDSTMDVIRKSGLPNYNRGHLGHGNGVFLGLEESPFVSTHATESFTSGMVLSLETPYYGYNLGSIMIEDMILINKDSFEFLSKLPRDLVSFN